MVGVMNKVYIDDFKEFAQKMHKNFPTYTIDEICQALNKQFEDFYFYVQYNTSIVLDCSDYSPRDVKIL